MKIVCPEDGKHKRFTASAHVAQDWVMDEAGTFVEATNNCSDVIHYPDKDDYYTCKECGAKAEVEG